MDHYIRTYWIGIGGLLACWLALALLVVTMMQPVAPVNSYVPALAAPAEQAVTLGGVR